MNQATQEETYGKLILSDLLTNIWYGNWDKYEEILSQVPDALVRELPFHEHYDREETSLWYDNHFRIPGAYFIPPYLSSYNDQSQEAQEQARQDVLCLIGEYEKFGFYYPLEQEEFPDHFGSVTAFITAAINAEVKASQTGDEELVEQLKKLQRNIYTTHLKKNIHAMVEHAVTKTTDDFFRIFIPFYVQIMNDIMAE